MALESHKCKFNINKNLLLRCITLVANISLLQAKKAKTLVKILTKFKEEGKWKET